MFMPNDVHVLSLTLLLSIGAAAQPEEQACRRMQESAKAVTEYMVRAARAITDRAAEELRSSESWKAVEAQRRQQLREMLGLLPWPRRTPLHARITGALDQGRYFIEKIGFESLPRVYVTANLYVPKERKGPLPAVIYACGHNGGKGKYQHYGQSLARNGYIAFILDPIQNAEAFGVHHGVYDGLMYDWYSRGYTPAGIETWNAMRALDYLETRSEVDKHRIGMSGFSGGAFISYFTAAVDPRIKAVAPFMGTSTYAANLQYDAQKLHCDCMFPINSHRQDLTHLGALIAPRPLLQAQGKQDSLFPVAGYREFAERVGALYDALQHPDAFHLLEIDSGHEDTEYTREQAIRWFDRNLLAIPDRKLDLEYALLPEATLAVFPAGAPGDARNFRVHEVLTPIPPLRRFESLKAWESRRRELLALLRGKVLVRVPEKPRGVRLEREPAIEGLRMPFEEFSLESEDTVAVRILLRRRSGAGGRQPALLYIASDGEDMQQVEEVRRGLRVPAGWSIMAVFPRGVGAIPWTATFRWNTLRNAMLIGETVDSMRLADVVVAVEALRAQEGVDSEAIDVVGKEISGVLGLYAAVLDPRIRSVTLIDPPATHVQGPILLNVLRYTDLPEAAALIAPRPLKFYMRLPRAYEYTRHVYQLYGRPTAFRRVAKVSDEP